MILHRLLRIAPSLYNRCPFSSSVRCCWSSGGLSCVLSAVLWSVVLTPVLVTACDEICHTRAHAMSRDTPENWMSNQHHPNPRSWISRGTWKHLWLRDKLGLTPTSHYVDTALSNLQLNAINIKQFRCIFTIKYYFYVKFCNVFHSFINSIYITQKNVNQLA